MQVLTGQYTKMYTYKWRVFYTDFQPSATNISWLFLRNLARTEEIQSVKLWPTAQFTGTGIGAGTIYVQDDQGKNSGNYTTNSYGRVNSQPVLANDKGVVQSVVARPYTSPTSTSFIIGNMVSAYGIWLNLTLPAGNVVNNLAAGTIEVWVTTIKRP